MEGRRVGDWPDLSHLSADDLATIPAMHRLRLDELGKVPVVDHKFCEGHVGFYEPGEVNQAMKQARENRTARDKWLKEQR